MPVKQIVTPVIPITNLLTKSLWPPSRASMVLEGSERSFIGDLV